jgi:hypothetical protein
VRPGGAQLQTYILSVPSNRNRKGASSNLLALVAAMAAVALVALVAMLAAVAAVASYSVS